jgi:superfamily II DNA helicase RecQ
MVQKKAASLAELKEIEGVGDARLEKYGEALLRILAAPPGR